MTADSSSGSAEHPQRVGGAQWWYRLGLAALAPALCGFFAHRITLGGKPTVGLRERLGWLPESVVAACRRSPGDRMVWIHAVSVGEAVPAQALAAAIQSIDSSVRIVVSSTTPSGREMAQSRLPFACAFFYLPYDLPWCVERTLDAVSPDALVIMETELWPNLLAAARERGIRTMIANARISDRAFGRFLRFRWLYRWVLSNVDLVAAQSPLCAQRFLDLGARPGRVQVLGNLKFDEARPDVSEDQCRELRGRLGFDERDLVLVFGSTAPEENEALLDAFAVIRAEETRARLIMAPRHLERVPDCVRAAEQHGFRTILRSQLPADGDNDRIVVLDTFGELATLYALSAVAFIGRSLVPLGGGNLLQPLGFAVPVVFGPHMENFREAARSALEAGLAFEVASSGDLAEVCCRLLRSPDERARIAERAPAFLADNAGAAGRHAEALAGLLGWCGTEAQ